MTSWPKMHVNVVLHHSDILHLGILRAVTAICLPDRPSLYEQTSFNCVDFRLRSAEHSSELDALLSLARKFAPEVKLMIYVIMIPKKKKALRDSYIQHTFLLHILFFLPQYLHTNRVIIHHYQELVLRYLSKYSYLSFLFLFTPLRYKLISNLPNFYKYFFLINN